MKTISVILAVFIFGLFGWFGIKKTPEQKPKEVKQKISLQDIRINEAELYCNSLECKIETSQKEIIKTIEK